MSNEIIDINEYKEILSSIKNEILKSQYRAMQVVNVEMIYMYWNIGKIISNNIKWGNKFVDNLAIDLKLEFPDITGFSPRNIRYMRKFAEEYQDEKFSKYYNNKNLYKIDNNQRVLVAVKNNVIVGTLIVSIETETKDLGCVGCTCVSFKETHQKIGTNMVRLGTKYLKDIGLKNASLSYTYS